MLETAQVSEPVIGPWCSSGMRRVLLVTLLPAFLLAGCDSNTSSSVDEIGSDRIGSGRTAADVTQAQAYLEAEVIQKNPASCFASPLLDRVSLNGPGNTSSEGELVAPRQLVIAIDGSGSMAARIGGRTKLELAREAALAFLDGLPDDVDAALVVFGHKGNNTLGGKAASCSAIEITAPLSADRSKLRAAVGDLQAVGWTPLASGLERSASLLANGRPGEQIIYVVSDGEETCGGDPVAVAQRINAGPARAIVNIVGFGVPAREAQALSEVAAAGGGRFVEVGGTSERRRFLDELRERNRPFTNALRAGNARFANDLRTNNAVSAAKLCAGNLTAGELLRFNNKAAASRRRGQAFSFETTARTLLEQRHARIESMANEHEMRLRRAAADAGTAIRDETQATR